MLMNLIIGFGAGYLTPYLEPKIKDWAESIVLAPVELRKTEFDLLSLLVMLMIAALVLAVIGVDSSVMLVAVGAALGLFGKRIWSAIVSRSKKSDTVDAADADAE